MEERVKFPSIVERKEMVSFCLDVKVVARMEPFTAACFLVSKEFFKLLFESPIFKAAEIGFKRHDTTQHTVKRVKSESERVFLKSCIFFLEKIFLLWNN